MCEFTHIYNGILQNHKQKTSLPFATTWIDVEGTVLYEIDRQILQLSFTCGISKNQTNEFNKTETEPQIQRTNKWLPVRKGKLGEARQG